MGTYLPTMGLKLAVTLNKARIPWWIMSIIVRTQYTLSELIEAIEFSFTMIENTIDIRKDTLKTLSDMEKNIRTEMVLRLKWLHGLMKTSRGMLSAISLLSDGRK